MQWNIFCLNNIFIKNYFMLKLFAQFPGIVGGMHFIIFYKIACHSMLYYTWIFLGRFYWYLYSNEQITRWQYEAEGQFFQE